ncbi:hypothetical protein JRQ81_009707 [Phrynocephalus forsythii]|uniref:Centromere protein S n=1 Tax=Phrynocephalus forsythii TaxID=171643 RepID=A0A9Q0XAP6_9SAUR|nr:hypothetical protein JRQ81_009707 [Phrynocephalus forsythii]
MEEALSDTERLRAAFHYTVACLCEDVAEDKERQFSKQAIAAISETTFRQCEIFAKDLELFARHAKRSTINVEDVKLLARRSNSLRLQVPADASKREALAFLSGLADWASRMNPAPLSRQEKIVPREERATSLQPSAREKAPCSPVVANSRNAKPFRLCLTLPTGTVTRHLLSSALMCSFLTSVKAWPHLAGKGAVAPEAPPGTRPSAASHFLRLELSHSPHGSFFFPFERLLKECKAWTCSSRLDSSSSQARCNASVLGLSQFRARARASGSSL